ncbi:MAG: cytochrome c maturation protein CcmE [Carboxydocellales bacterium]
MPTSKEQDFGMLPNRLKPFIWVLALCAVIISLAFPQMKTVFRQFSQIFPSKEYSPVSTKSLILNGILMSNTLYHENLRGSLHFSMQTLQGETIKVIYRGPNSPDLVNGAELAVEGSYSVERVFIAKRIWMSRSKQIFTVRQEDN